MQTIQAPAVSPLPVARTRVQSIDVLRGAVMVVMALDHVRDFLHYDAMHFAPEDLTQTHAFLFFTRWITHFCAPVFVMLAGTGAALSLGRGRSIQALSRFLWTRGLWLIVVEVTLINFAVAFNFTFDFIVWQVIWAIGWSMIALSALMFLPWKALLAFSVGMIAVHNAFDGVAPETFGRLGWLWQTLHLQSFIELNENHSIVVLYPLIPWVGVMSAGYCLGRVMEFEGERRRRVLLVSGIALTAAFLVIRLANVYGDPSPWAMQPTAVKTMLSFLNASKYPPSLLYLLMTIGPALMLLSALDQVAVGPRNPFLVFGRVPFFYYLIHIYVIHLVALVLAQIRYGRFDFMFARPPSLLPLPGPYPADYGYSLAFVYLCWIAIVAALYPLCLWFAGVKARSRSAWVSYF